MIRKHTTAILMILLGAVSVMARPEIKFEPPEALPSGQRIPLECEISPGKKVELARCYFKNDAMQDFVFSEMHRESKGVYRALLPAASAETAELEYLFLCRMKDGKVFKTRPYISRLRPEASLPSKLRSSEKAGVIKVFSERANPPERIEGIDDSVIVDAFESGVRLGIVAGIVTADGGGSAAAAAAAAGGEGAAAGGAAEGSVLAGSADSGAGMAGEGAADAAASSAGDAGAATFAETAEYGGLMEIAEPSSKLVWWVLGGAAVAGGAAAAASGGGGDDGNAEPTPIVDEGGTVVVMVGSTCNGSDGSNDATLTYLVSPPEFSDSFSRSVGVPAGTISVSATLTVEPANAGFGASFPPAVGRDSVSFPVESGQQRDVAIDCVVGTSMADVMVTVQ